MKIHKFAIAIIFFIVVIQRWSCEGQNSPDDYLEAHNSARAKVGVGPMVWEARVAAFAQNFVNQRIGDCKLVHSTNTSYGENLAEGSGNFTGRDAVGLWVSEKQNYNYETNSCVGGECLHYTQVVWQNSTGLGCARARCKNSWWFVSCNYDPPGNYVGQRAYGSTTIGLQPPLQSSPPPPPPPWSSESPPPLQSSPPPQLSSESPPPLLLLPPDLSRKKNNIKTEDIAIIIISIVVFISLVFGVGFFIKNRIKQKTKEHSNIGEDGDGVSSVESLQFDFAKIRAATNDFSDTNKLGQGGFGIVYKGKLQNGRDIAVKRLSSSSSQGDVEFKNEVLLVAKLQHRNLVRLLGFCIQGIERILVYEFVLNGSLDHFIFDPIRSTSLDWGRRFKIIRGIARGLLYLHEDSRLRIIHRDLKASNILLDEEMNPKISDFGLAKLVVPDATQESTTRIVGTFGYMAPEYAFHGKFSIKSDVYSFGVLVLEIVTGQKRIFLQNGQNSGDNILSYAWRSWREGTSANMIDTVLTANGGGGGGGGLEEMVRCIHIALLCVQQNPEDRPTMASIVVMFNSLNTITLPLPSEPGFYIASEASKIETNRSRLHQPFYSSAGNRSSITHLHPR